MVEKRLRLRPNRPRTPEGLTLAERVMWKRYQMRDEQSRKRKRPPAQAAQFTEKVRAHAVGVDPGGGCQGSGHR